jgi:DNA-binding transcriptional regulator YiaG
MEYEEAAEMIRRAAAGMRALVRQGAARRAAERAPGKAQEVATALGIDGDAVKRAREYTGLTQQELARRRGWSRGSLAEVERGKRPPPEAVARWAAMVLRTMPKEVTR